MWIVGQNEVMSEKLMHKYVRNGIASYYANFLSKYINGMERDQGEIEFKFRVVSDRVLSPITSK